jgi:hypothetical protein
MKLIIHIQKHLPFSLDNLNSTNCSIFAPFYQQTLIIKYMLSFSHCSNTCIVLFNNTCADNTGIARNLFILGPVCTSLLLWPRSSAGRRRLPRIQLKIDYFIWVNHQMNHEQTVQRFKRNATTTCRRHLMLESTYINNIAILKLFITVARLLNKHEILSILYDFPICRITFGRENDSKALIFY